MGAPDLVVEVVSASSVKKNLQWLRAAYARAGIAEYWCIDARGDAVLFEILELRGGDYVAASRSTEPQRSLVLDRSFALERSRNRLGRFSYALRILP